MENLTYSQKKRLAYIDFRLMFVGHFSRAEVVEHFQMGLSAATRDINLYKELVDSNLTYDNAEKRYFQTDSFEPLFEHEPKRALSKLVNQNSGIANVITDIKFPFEAPSQLSSPEIEIIASLTQAVLNTRAVKINYVSLSNGESTRVIIPHSIIDSGLRWHVRAFDLKTEQFRDFVIARMTSAKVSDLDTEDHQRILADQQWMRIVPLELVPHPNNIKHPKAIELDYAMKNGVLKLEVRAALAGYLLRRWNVDCSDEASQNAPEHQLWLQNSQTLYGVENINLASGSQPKQSIPQEHINKNEQKENIANV